MTELIEVSQSMLNHLWKMEQDAFSLGLGDPPKIKDGDDVLTMAKLKEAIKAATIPIVFFMTSDQVDREVIYKVEKNRLLLKETPEVLIFNPWLLQKVAEGLGEQGVELVHVRDMR